MSLRYWMQQPGGELLDVTDRCRAFVTDLQEHAEEGATAVNTLTIDDPEGDFYPYEHRVFAVEETEAVDLEDRFVFVGFMGKPKITRGPGRTGAARQWVCEISDVNTLIERRVMVGGGNERPEDESDNERIAWLLQTNESQAIDDTRYVTTDNDEDMDEADYNQQQASAVWRDCAEQSGKNYYLTYFGDVGVTAETPWGSFAAWYDLPESEEYQSSAKLTNILSEVDVAAGIFYIGLQEETSLTIDGQRIYWRVVVPFKNSYVVASNPTTADTYAKRDLVMPAENVKRKATALRRAQRAVNSLGTPEHRATVKTYVPRRLVNLIRPGMDVPVRVSHWTGYEDEYQNMRVLSRRVLEVSQHPEGSLAEDYADDVTPAFQLTLELSRSEPGPPPQPLYGILRGSGGPYSTENGSQLVHWANPGDTPGPGFPYEPTVGPLTVMTDASPPHLQRTHWGWRVDGDGTVDVAFFATTYGVTPAFDVTVTFEICLNGVAVESTSMVAPALTGGWGGDRLLEVEDLDVVNGDIITARITQSPIGLHFFRTPRGTGQNGERLEITGGSVS